jgi:hypothetical protein
MHDKWGIKVNICTESRMRFCMSEKNHSESLFESYLRNLQINFVYESEVQGRRKRPDYRVEKSGKVCWFEVKELFEPEVKPTGWYDPTDPLEEKIDQARKKFKEYKDSCCTLVLHSCKSIYRPLMIPGIISAAFGEYLSVEPSQGQTLVDEPLRFKYRGKAKLRTDVNTTVSAIILLQHYQLESRWVDAFYRIRERIDLGESIGPFAYAEEFESMNGSEGEIEFGNSVRTVVLENPHARIRFPSQILGGPLDQRWGMVRSSGWYSPISMGSELIKLRAREKPVPYLFL